VQSDLERENQSHEAERQRQHEDVQAAAQRDHDLTTGQQQIEGQIAVTKAKPQPMSCRMEARSERPIAERG
jgi:hypothetical protein